MSAEHDQLHCSECAHLYDLFYSGVHWDELTDEQQEHFNEYVA